MCKCALHKYKNRKTKVTELASFFSLFLPCDLCLSISLPLLIFLSRTHTQFKTHRYLWALGLMKALFPFLTRSGGQSTWGVLLSDFFTL